MAVVLTQRVSDDEIFGIWEITETEEELRNRLHKTPWIDNMMEGVTHPMKILEFLTSRFLTEHIAIQIGLPFAGIFKDTHGKPFPVQDLSEQTPAPTYHLSLSHSYPFAASCIHLKKPVGIDIEMPREKLAKVSRKYIHEEETALTRGNEIDQLCIIWAAKEAVFKMNGRSGLSLKEDIIIRKIENTKKKVFAEVRINGKIEQVSIDYFQYKNNWIAFTR